MTGAFQAMKSSITVVDVLTHYALLHFVCDLKVTQMNMHCSLIWKLMLYDFELHHNVTKNIYCIKSEGAIDHSTVNR